MTMMEIIEFPEQPDLRPVPGDRYRLVSAYRYRWDHGGWDRRMTVPALQVTDGASIPRIAWTLAGITPDGEHRAAALLHDFIYAWKGRLPLGTVEVYTGDGWRPSQGTWTREQADSLFARVLRESGVSKFRRRMMWRAVRMFGGVAWNKPLERPKIDGAKRHRLHK